MQIFYEHFLILLVQFFDMNIEKVLIDQKIMLRNYYFLNEYHEIAQGVKILLPEQWFLNFYYHQLYV
jgi:hypothetical protein